ncbi:PH domain-containing protein [Flavobacterium jejuense]|uniref:PH domain-containing protein n=1 Tax=Flavobacterium jejuense TaxID=1544455 RepID=A0ABX0IN35_9FLAO|nr:PH domain-containing protein [Flavobacterium jejuense]NHN24199.1 PH domain-containing protein [Flavobacterium jejuense]
MIYKSSISKSNKIVFSFIFLIIILATIPVFYCNNLIPFIIVVSINLVALFFLVWILVDTEYRTDKTNLYCKSGPFQKTIPIASIKKIKHHNGFIIPVAFKPALNHIGLIINYNQHDQIYISPENESEFIDIIIRTNSNIKVIPKKDEL